MSFRLLAPWGLVAGLMACNGDDGGDVIIDTVETDLQVSAFDQIGGEKALHDVIDQFVVQVGEDVAVNWMFANADLNALNSAVYDQACQALGGPCTYSGPDMLTVHAGMAITETQWGTTMQDLLDAITLVADGYIENSKKAEGNALRYSGHFDGSKPMDALILAVSGMHDDIVEDPSGDTAYFNQLGGLNGIKDVVEELLVNVGEDARINHYFAETDLAALDALLVEQICEATGGYCVYSGRSMLATHAGLCISDADFDALVEDLLAAINKSTRYDPENGSAPPYSAALDGSGLFDNLLIVLSGMRGDIVETCTL
jgi:hemoglobin